MKNFITKSKISKKLLQIAQMSASLPVNIFISGDIGVGKRILAKQIFPNATEFDAQKLEMLITKGQISLGEYSTLILYNFNQVLNKQEFLNKLEHIKIIATGYETEESYINKFAVKINIPPLKQRPEDLDQLILNYIDEAKNIYNIQDNINIKNIDYDLSCNGKTLKQSIYKNILLQSLDKDEMTTILRDFYIKEFENKKDYKKLLQICEKPLLEAATTVFKSQLQIANNLNINRITLRKKLNKYFGE